MPNPCVSFVVPCYKLAHLLPECINSILSQTFGDFEVLIMDDHSPDNTAEIANSFKDPRIRYVRNDPNLGHLRNYNKGIGLSRGAYVWLISADDYLRKPYVLQRYVGLLETHPGVGYVFCPGYGVRDGVETRLLGRYSVRRDHDRIFAGHALLKRLLQSNFVLTPSGMVRRECYDKISLFPLDMPWAGDWYLWCLFALHCDVGYFTEPMVCYREHHPLSMTSKLTREKLDACAAEELAIAWAITRKARDRGNARVAKSCLYGLAHTYARTLASERFRDSSYFMNLERMETSLREYIPCDDVRSWVQARVYAGVANELYWQKDFITAKQFYHAAIKKDPWMLGVNFKRLLLSFGKTGDNLRELISSLR
jgi:glycosyltransferase involved in cell wall biosynthesis